MRLIVLGGSNSVKRDGWVAQLAAAMPDAQMMNCAIGAANSLMAYFRLRQIDDLGPGDVVFWEYALNDQEQVSNTMPLGVEKALKYVELAMRHTARREARFLPVILRPRRFADDGVYSLYRLALLDMFDRYGVRPIDAYARYSQAHDGASMPKDDYYDMVHLRADGRVVRLSVQECVERLRQPEPPVKMPARSWVCGPLDDVRVVTEFENAATAQFSSSLVNQKVWRPGAGGEMIYRPEEGTWRIISVMSVGGTEQIHYGLRAGAVTQFFEAFHRLPRFPKSVLRMQDITPRRPFEVSPEAPLHFVGWAAPHGPLPPEVALRELPERAGLAGLLMERVPPPAPAAVPPRPTPLRA